MREYDHFAKTFSESRKNLKWRELDTIVSDIRREWYGSILDVGAGNGRFLEFFGDVDRDVEYLGLDSSLGMIDEAKKLHPERDFRVMPMQEVTREKLSKTYDAVVFLASFHHLETVEERMSVLENFRDIVSDHGKIYMTNWNLLEQPRYREAHVWNGDFQIKIGEFSRYYHGFTLSELETLFLSAGYSILEHRIFDGGRNIYSVLELPPSKNEKRTR